VDTQNLIQLLHHHERTIGDATADCPDDEKLAALFHNKAGQQSGEVFNRHLSDCPYCRARTGVIAQAQSVSETEDVPPEMLEKAIRLVDATPAKQRRQAPLWAAAAIVAVALAVVFDPQTEPAAINEIPATVTEPRPLRNIDQISPRPMILAPANGTQVSKDQLLLRWTRVPGSLYYDVRLVDARGFVLWTDRVQDTERRILPAELQLAVEQPYFVRVDAYLAEAKSVGSEHVLFTIKASEP
jgi:hypothetical protein